MERLVEEWQGKSIESEGLDERIETTVAQGIIQEFGEEEESYG